MDLADGPDGVALDQFHDPTVVFAGMDLRAAVPADRPMIILPGRRALVPTGISIAIPMGHGGFVLPRSGMAMKHGISVVNAPGLIDAAYRGEIKVSVINLDPVAPVVFHRGDRIAQLVIQAVVRARFHEVETLPGSARGAGGFGSTGGHAAG